MKFKAQWFLDGKEVELPEMKIEGSLAVAELTKEHVDEFVPFLTSVQEESQIRLQLNVLSEFLATTTPSEQQVTSVLTVMTFYKKDWDKIDKVQVKVLVDELSTKLLAAVEKTARVSIETAPFFLRRSILEAYYMIKAYIYEEARRKNEKPKMPFEIDDLKSLISDAELAQFTQHSISKMQQAAVPETAPPSQEDLKKN